MNIPSFLTCITSLVATTSFLSAQVPAGVPWATPNGKIVQNGILAATCGVLDDSVTPGAPQYTFGLVDVRGADLAPTPDDSNDDADFWFSPMYHHPQWTITDIGNVFGITYDSSRNVYLTASSSFNDVFLYTPGVQRYGNIGGGANALTAAGTIYKIDAVTGAPAVFAQLPQQSTVLTYAPSANTRATGPGLGNICHDATHNQFFVSNFEDGKIYRISSTGVILDSFDPFSADNGNLGFAPQSERVWAVQMYEDKLFFSRGEGPTGLREILSKELTPSGGFAASLPILEASYDVGSLTNARISDISFSSTGQMMVAERSMINDVSSWNHGAKLRIFTNVAGTWVQSNVVAPGHSNGVQNFSFNSNGGADWGYEGGIQDGRIWVASGDLIRTGSYDGLQSWRVEDTPVNGEELPYGSFVAVPYLPDQPVFLDLDIKGFGGDVEVFNVNDYPTAGDCELSVGIPAVPPCSAFCYITDISVTGGACNDNETPNDASDDYYISRIGVTFSGKPATGNLVLSGAALHVSNGAISIPVGSTDTFATHTFQNVRVMANNASSAVIATFSADPTCPFTVNAPTVAPCSTPACDMTDVAVTPGACNDNGTPNDATDDYYTASVTTTFANKPATGNLVLSGVALHSSNSVSTVVVGSTTSATTHNFVGVKLKANGVANAITATFSADPACTMTVNTSVVPECSTPPVECCPQIILGAP